MPVIVIDVVDVAVASRGSSRNFESTEWTLLISPQPREKQTHQKVGSFTISLQPSHYTALALTQVLNAAAIVTPSQTFEKFMSGTTALVSVCVRVDYRAKARLFYLQVTCSDEIVISVNYTTSRLDPVNLPR